MTTPTPMPTVVTFHGVPLTVGPETDGSDASGYDNNYGLGDWANVEINPGDLPFLVELMAGKKPSPTTGDNIVRAFASASPVPLAEVQRTLYLGGFYSKTYTPSYGVVAPQDVQAFAKAVILAGQAGGSVSDLLLSRAKYGTAAGIAAAQTQLAKASKTTVTAIPVPATGDLEAQAMTAFENTLGHKAKPHEAAAFAAAYQAMVVGIGRGNAVAEQQATAQASGGLTAGQAQDFQTQLAQIGHPQPNLTPQEWHGINNGLGPTPPAVPDAGFAQQLGELQSLGEAVTAAAAAKTPTIGGARTIEEEQPEDASVAAANFARNEHPKAAAKTDIGTALDNFFSIIGSRM